MPERNLPPAQADAIIDKLTDSGAKLVGTTESNQTTKFFQTADGQLIALVTDNGSLAPTTKLVYAATLKRTIDSILAQPDPRAQYRHM